MKSSQEVIAIVDDDAEIRQFLEDLLLTKGYSTRVFRTGKEVLEFLEKDHPALVILDLGLPGMDGLEVLSRLRSLSTVPVVILSVRDREEDKVRGLDLGANDYLTKPFGSEELLARIRSALRYAAPPTQPILEFGRVILDRTARRVTKDGRDIKLSDLEYRLLLFLAERQGALLTHREILRGVWGGNAVERIEYLRVYVQHLRTKLEDDPNRPQIILTEAGIGYRLSPPAG